MILLEPSNPWQFVLTWGIVGRASPQDILGPILPFFQALAWSSTSGRTCFYRTMRQECCGAVDCLDLQLTATILTAQQKKRANPSNDTIQERYFGKDLKNLTQETIQHFDLNTYGQRCPGSFDASPSLLASIFKARGYAKTFSHEKLLKDKIAARFFQGIVLHSWIWIL